MDKNTSNLIINEIMSSKSNSTIILTKSDAQHIGFLMDLAHNYRNTFWVNETKFLDYSLAYAITDKILKNTSILDNIYRFANCRSFFTKDFIILNEVIKYISSMKESYLLVIESLEKIYSDFNLKALEFLFKKCPANLKIVVVSEKFLDIDYNIFKDEAPKLITKEQLITSDFEDDVFDNDFSDDDYKFLYNVSLKGFADSEFINKFYPKGNEILHLLSAKYKSIIMRTGDGIYNINVKLAEIIHKKKLISDYSTEVFEDKLFDFYCKKGGKNVVRALKFAVDKNDVKLIDTAIKYILEKREFQFHLYEYASSLKGKRFFEPKDKKNIYARYFQILVDIFGNKNYEYAIKESEEFIKEFDELDLMHAQVESCIVIALVMMGNRNDCSQIASDYIEYRLDKYGEDCLVGLTEVISFMPLELKQIYSQTIFKKCRIVEAYLLQKKFENEYWYVGLLQTFVGMNLDFGNYRLATEHLNKIKELIPFYTVPHTMVNAYMFSGDMESARKNAFDIIEASRWNGNESALVGVYTMLGIISVYYNRRDEALKYLNTAVELKSDIKRDEDELYYAICLRAIVCSDFNMDEYAKDIMMIYVKRSEIMDSPFGSITYGAAAYCFWKAGDKDNALFYAKKCLLESPTKSYIWLMCTAIIIIDLLKKEDFKAVDTFVDKFFNVSKRYGMEMVSVICYKLFSPILEYAWKNSIEPEYLELIRSLIEKRKKSIKEDEHLKIKMMGNTTVFKDLNELIWKTRKAKELFMLYVLSGEEGVDRMEILKYFWSDYVYVSAVNNLKTTNNIIRNTLTANGIKFKLDYYNSKYILTLEDYEVDYYEYKKIFDKIELETDLYKKGSLLLQAVSIYGDGFATDVRVPYFVSLHDKTKEELIFTTAKLIKELENAGETFEAKRYIWILKKLYSNTDGIVSEFVKKGNYDNK